MIVQLNVTNRTNAPIVVNSQSATGQNLVPNQALQATFELQEDPETGIAVLHLYIDPGR